MCATSYSKTKAIRGQFFSHHTNLVYSHICIRIHIHIHICKAQLCVCVCACTKCVLIMNYDLFFQVKSNSISLGLFANFSFRIARRSLQRGKNGTEIIMVDYTVFSSIIKEHIDNIRQHITLFPNLFESRVLFSNPVNGNHCVATYSLFNIHLYLPCHG